ncbi:unannotated protein [freshwater metagenome]|uniref:Unannotated protein n=1 Tax=freshwater metagenome TaxID=449393 RepID=A0A6J7EI63_9ZZZZ|nr:cupin domain-containing protein [Actinomycetota bacterium]
MTKPQSAFGAPQKDRLSRRCNGGDIVLFEQLEPTWNNPHAREEGHLRWIVSYFGGTPGQINDNPETGLLSTQGSAGLMWLQAGGRQYGVHQHTMRETYVILKGQVESIEPGRSHLAGPLDCLTMPPGAPHAVRAVGSEDVVLLWCHDANEEIGRSQYYDESDDRWDSSRPPVDVVRWDALAPTREEPGAHEGGTRRTTVTWLEAERGPSDGVLAGSVRLGCTTIEPGSRLASHSHPFTEHFLVISGRASVVGPQASPALGRWDYVRFEPGVVHSLRAIGDEPAQLLWLQEGTAAQRAGHDGECGELA